jgi:DNA polymerase III epsilon subunit-like protein
MDERDESCSTQVSVGLPKRKILTIDTETTGLPNKEANYESDFMSYPFIVTLAYKINDEETKYFIINQEGRLIPEDSIRIHGITNEMANASTITAAMALLQLLDDAAGAEEVVGHNLFFDTSIIKANVLRMVANNTVPPSTFERMEELLHKDRRVDTMHKTTKFCNIPGKYGAKWPTLVELHFKLFNENFEAHNSKEDVDATYKCYLKLKELKVL